MTFSRDELLPSTGYPGPLPSRGTDYDEIARRSAAFLDINVANPFQRAAFDAMDQLRASAPGRRDKRQYAIRITAASGAGKSTLAKRFRDVVLARGSHSKSDLPVVYAELEQACTPKRMWAAVLHAYGDEYWNEGTLEDLRIRALRLIRERKTDLLLIDEVQHLFHRSKDGIAATDAIKRLLDAGVCSLALIGDLDGRRLLESNPQLVNRMVTPADIRVLDPTDSEDLSMLAGFLRQYDQRMAAAGLHPELAGLEDPRMVMGLMDAGKGLLGVMVNLIREASDHAYLRKAKRIEPFDLAAAARMWSSAQGRQRHNPFVLG